MQQWLPELTKWLENTLGISPELALNICSTLIILAIWQIIKFITIRLIRWRSKDLAKQYIRRKTLQYIYGTIVLILLLRIWFGGFTGIAAYIGILSAGLAIALQDPLVNLAGWLFISVRQPFVVGDRIEIGGHRGDVIDIRLFQFSLLEVGNWVDADQSTGRIIHVPNGLVFKQAQGNFTQGFDFIWHEIPVMITFESDWEKAKAIIKEVADSESAVKTEQAAKQIRKAARKYLIFFQHLSPIVWTNVADSGIVLTARFLCNVRKRRSSESEFWEEILRRFKHESTIDLAYPTVRYYNNKTEGKSSSPPPPP